MNRFLVPKWRDEKRPRCPRVSPGVLLLAAAFLSACSEGKSSPPKTIPPVPVQVVPVSQKTVPVQLSAIGNVEAYATVAIKARVGGELTQVFFQEGQDVKKGELLFRIDPRPFEAALSEAQARLARDQALAEKARRDTNRYASLIQKKVVSQEQADQVHANLAALEAAVRADEAAVENARLQLSYCSVHAPISGRTGSLLVNAGNLIKANDDNKSMVVIRQIQPIRVVFSVPEQYLPEIKRRAASQRLEVTASIREGQHEPLVGELSFIDNVVDQSTGTILLKATYPNTDRSLWPGQFVDVSVVLSLQRDVVVIPSHAIQAGQEGPYVYVVKPDLTVENRNIRAGRSVDGETVVETGLQPGEQVVTEGQLRLSPGARVEIKNPESPSRPAS